MRIPVATYRLQIKDDFTLADARAVVPYLARLGVSDLYLSPIFEARSGSTHGYDVTDPTRIRESVGGMDALRELSAEVHRHHMGILLDIVPNHMAASVENPWWKDMLTHGPQSLYASFFDVDWGSAERIELPILGDRLDALLDRGEITIDSAEREVVYHDTRLPLRPGTDVSGDPRTILSTQHYELVFWRRASEHMGYRRFFDITDLAGVRVEDPDVFDATHSLIRDLVGEGIITGLRIDHVDGLRDPAGYLERLRERIRDPQGEPVYTVVEKILEQSERLPADWACEGTTGYEFLNLATGLLVHPEGLAATDAFYQRITGDRRTFAELVREKKLLVLDRLFGGELSALGASFARLAGIDAGTARTAVAQLTASMPVYRTYTRSHTVRSEDVGYIEHAHADANARAKSETERDTLDSLRRLVSMEEIGIDRSAQLDWVMRWQQFTGPVMAKGFEDTALYCHNALLAVNDVGSNPADPSIATDRVHDTLAARFRTIPLALNATATHDTKRGEDTRARIAVITEVADEWQTRLRRWMRAGDQWQDESRDDEEAATPSADVQSLLYQTLVGSWPLTAPDAAYLKRIKTYMTKAVREAKEQTSWRRPDEDYEEALHAFIEALMQEFGREGLADDVEEFARRIAPHGALNSLSQMLLKVTAPGIPDIYQGTELWSFTLVDPDNRQPVDYAARERLLDALVELRDSPSAERSRELLENWQDGAIKLLLTSLVLRFRARHREVFENGTVVKLSTEGVHAESVVAFARSMDERTCIVVLPRWSARFPTPFPLGRAWGDTHLVLSRAFQGTWHNALTGETHQAGEALPLTDLFRNLPFALLEVSQPVGA